MQITVLEHALPHPLTVPFMLYNLRGQARPGFSQWIPGGILELVPGAWKEEWESMTPFLLE